MTEPVLRTLYRGGVVDTPTDPAATAMLVEGDRIAWLGAHADAPPADTTFDLAGAVVTAAFVDAHVHTTDTGLTLLGLDLTGATSADDLLERVAAHAAGLPTDAVLIGHGWDESGWPLPHPPSAAELDRAAGGRRAYLARACTHSAVVSHALLASVPEAAGATGYHPSGWLRRDAHHAARTVALGSVGAAQRRAAQQAALRRAAAVGVAAVHECAGPVTSSEEDLTGLLALAAAGDLPAVYGYWGEPGAAGKARELGAVGAGGDLYADGALGSHTAHLREAYLDAPGTGAGYLDARQVAAHVVDCVRHEMQAGFHAIGDAAIGTVLDGFEQAAAQVGRERLRAGRHRVEHALLADRAQIAALVGYGLVASVQPAFDARWGGETGMYAQRLGRTRALAANPFGSLAGVGVCLAFGSDSPVTPIDPWAAVRAATAHHNPIQRLSTRAAFAAHTRGGAHAVHRDDEGVLLPGAPATFAVWHAPGGVTGGLPALWGAGAGEPLPPPACRRTVLRGQVIFDGS